MEGLTVLFLMLFFIWPLRCIVVRGLFLHEFDFAKQICLLLVLAGVSHKSEGTMSFLTQRHGVTLTSSRIVVWGYGCWTCVGSGAMSRNAGNFENGKFDEI